MSSTDSKLGLEIQELLEKHNLATPTNKAFQQDSEALKNLDSLEKSFTDIVTTLGLDLADDSITDTPKRLAKMYYNELCAGLQVNQFPKVTKIENKGSYDEIVLIKQIEVKSMCEHHFVPINGFAHIAYIPDKWVLGLSKFNRITEYFSRRPQIQERLTEQVHLALTHILGTEDVAVVIDAEHFCVKFRGVEDPCSSTVTSKMGGRFRNQETRNELFSLINLKQGN